MTSNEWNRYGVNEHVVKAMRSEAFNVYLLSIGRVDLRDRLREQFENSDRPAIELRQHLLSEAAKATATESASVHNDYADHVDNGLSKPITSAGFEDYIKNLNLFRRRLPAEDPRSMDKDGEDRLLAERIYAKFLTDPTWHERVETAREKNDTAGDLNP